MDQSRFEVDLIVLRGILYQDLIDLKSLNIIELDRVQGNSIKLVPQLVKIFKKNRYDIIYTPGIPIKIHGEHGTFERSYLKDKLQKFLWKHFDAVTVVVDDLEKKLREIFDYKADNIKIK
jgi:hypothetical protein